MTEITNVSLVLGEYRHLLIVIWFNKIKSEVQQKYLTHVLSLSFQNSFDLKLHDLQGSIDIEKHSNDPTLLGN